MKAGLTSPGLRSFVDRWRSAFTCTPRGITKCDIDPEVWDRLHVVVELERTGWLDFVTPSPEFEDIAYGAALCRHLFREVKIYEEVSRIDITRNQETADALQILFQAEKRFRVAASRVSTAGLKYAFSKVAQLVADERSDLEKHRDDYWKRALFATRAEESKWYIDFESNEKVLPRVVPQELLQAETMFENLTFPRALLRKSNLDKRFQIRAAAVMRRYLPDVSLETLSRMVVLCYLCGDLVTVADRKAYLRTSNPEANSSRKRMLTFGGVQQKLKEQTALKRQPRIQSGFVKVKGGWAKKAN